MTYTVSIIFVRIQNKMSKYNLGKNRSKRLENDLDSNYNKQQTQSRKSFDSNRSIRSMLFQRSDMKLVQSRISNHSSSTSRIKNKYDTINMNNSRKYNIQMSKPSNSRQKSIGNSDKYYPRSKSSSSIPGLKSSRTELLSNIAEKLRNHNQNSKEKNPYFFQSNRSSAHHSRRPSREQQQEIQRKNAQRQRRNMKTKLSKLQRLLGDVKKSNQQTNQIVSTVKRSPQIAQIEQYRAQQKYEQYPNFVSYQNGLSDQRVQIQLLADQLKLVRQELQDVKTKNDELLNISRHRNNFETRSFTSQSGLSSRYINSEYQSPEVNKQYITQRQMKNHGQDYRQNQNFAKKFIKKQNQAYVAVVSDNILQPCFACGCTCKSRKNAR